MCFDLNNGKGPDIDLWACHGTDNFDYVNQQIAYNVTTRAIQPVRKPDSNEPQRCLTLERSAPLPNAVQNDDDPWADGQYKKRVGDMLRFLKSSGINTLVLNDVNACGDPATRTLQIEYETN